MLPASAPHLRQLKQPDAARKINFLVYIMPDAAHLLLRQRPRSLLLFCLRFLRTGHSVKMSRGACGHLQVLGQAQAH